MKRILFVLLALFALVGCKKQFEYQFYSDGKPLFAEPMIITAEDEEDAYDLMVIRCDEYFAKFEKDYLEENFYNTEITLELKNHKNGAIIENSFGFVPDIITDQKEYKEEQAKIREEEKKAFAGATFGMSINEVMRIPFYKDDFYKSNHEEIKGFDVYIGRESYSVRLLFRDNELYRVLFTNPPQIARYLDTSIKNDVENLKGVIEGACGAPTTRYNYPSVIDLNEGMVSWVYKWEIGKKSIRVGVSEDFDGFDYNVYAEIINKEVEEEIKEEEDKENRPGFFDDSDLF